MILEQIALLDWDMPQFTSGEKDALGPAVLLALPALYWVNAPHQTQGARMLVYNSQTHKKEELVPIEPGKIRMYVCGPTVYDQIHIGNARTFHAFDVIRR